MLARNQPERIKCPYAILLLPPLLTRLSMITYRLSLQYVVEQSCPFRRT